MTPTETPREKHGRNRVFLFLLVLFFHCSPFRTATYDNESTRLDLSFSIIVRGATDIDACHRNTTDKAFVKGRYYCDKAPGVSVAALPILPLFMRLVPGGAPRCPTPSAHYVLTVFTIALPSALTSVLLYGFIAAGAGAAAGLLSATAYALGTMAFPYSTIFMDHQFAANLLAASFFLLLPLLRGGEASRARLFAGGFLSGWAVISEFPSAGAAAIIAAAAILASRRRRTPAWLAAGAAPPALALLLYNHLSFGSPFSIGYFFEAHEYYREGMSAGFVGLTYPNPLKLFSLLFSPSRGLFWGSPFLLFCAPGFVQMFRRGGWERTVGWVCLLSALARLLIASSYYEPWGGFAPGPRFLTGALPFMAIAAAAARPKGAWKHLFAALCLYSVLHHALLSFVEPRVPLVFRHPAVEYAAALLREGYRPGAALMFAGVDSPAAFLLFLLAAAGALGLFIRLASPAGIRRAYVSLPACAVLAGCLPAIARISPTPQRELAAYYTGVALRQNGILDSAEKKLLLAVRIKPEFPEAHFALGITRVKTGRYSLAESDFKNAIRYGLKEPAAHVSLGALYIIRGDLTGARAVLADGRRKFPDSVEITELLSRLSSPEDAE
ncbi:MAG: hypothetical protein AB1742_00580 [bacterium]